MYINIVYLPKSYNFLVKYDKRYVYDVDLIKIKEKKELLTDEMPISMNKHILSQILPQEHISLKTAINLNNNLNAEDKHNLILTKGKNTGVPSNRQDVNFL